MAWIVLVVAGLFEAVWATALSVASRAAGVDKVVPLVVFVVATAISLGGLTWALRTLPVGTAYAVWTAIGAAATVTWAMVTGAEQVSVVKVLLLVGLVSCVVGLKVVSGAGH